MVYCKYISHTDSDVTYAAGALINDITGIVIFHFKDDIIEIEKEPNEEQLYIRHLQYVYFRNREDFRKGIFKDKLAHECG